MNTGDHFLTKREAVQTDFFYKINECENSLKEDEIVDFHARGNAVKHGGQVFTPEFLVKNILDYVEYTPGNILSKHFIDNSAGAGAFLCEAVRRYCREYEKTYGHTLCLKEELEKYIHGIEIDKSAYEECLQNLDETARIFGLKNVCWNVLNKNALKVSEFDSRMDFVVGNPPYVRVHNLENNYEDVKSFDFAQDGMTDLYLVFYELGFKMLNETGKLCYISPSSWLSSLAAANMRNFIMQKRNLAALVDLGHFQAFENATTYTMIALFQNGKKKDKIDYFSYSGTSRERVFVETFSYEDMSVGNCFYAAKKSDLAVLRKIKMTKSREFAQVKNGFATLSDGVFIGNIPFETLTIPILKASTGKWYRGFFPYDENGKPLSREEIFSNDNIARYLEENKYRLLKKRTEKQCPDWFLYGRSQALKDVQREKYSVNTIIKDVESVKLTPVPAGSGVYSGLYILTSASYETLVEILKTDEFIRYLALLKNYKSGGYYTFGSKDLEQFLNYKLSKYEKAKNLIPDDKYGLFKGFV